MIHPRKLGLPYSEWREDQKTVISEIVTTDKKFILADAPPGIGKMGIAIGAARVLGSRVHYLTPTKQLQGQYMRTDPEGRLVEVIGRGNFECAIEDGVLADAAVCTVGFECEHAGKMGTPGCPYYDQKRRAWWAQEVVTNPAYWLAQMTYDGGFAVPDFLVCDEAHELRDQLLNFATVKLWKGPAAKFGLPLPRGRVDFWDWKTWALENQERLTEIGGRFAGVPDPGDREGVRQARSFETLRTVMTSLRSAKDEWVVEDTGSSVEFGPVWPSDLAKKLLLGKFRDRALFMSATILSKSMFCGLLGIPEDEAEYIQLDSPFSVEGRPLIWWPVARYGRDGDDGAGLQYAVSELLKVEKGRGIVHTVSYALAQKVMALGDARLMTHGPKDKIAVLDKFRRTPGAVIVSPSLHTGVDLPYDLLRWQVIGKLPFPYKGDPRWQIMLREDQVWGKGNEVYTYDTACRLIQMYGRGMRAEDDYCKTYLVDAAFSWFRGAAKRYLSRWFMQAIRTREVTAEDEIGVLTYSR